MTAALGEVTEVTEKARRPAPADGRYLYLYVVLDLQRLRRPLDDRPPRERDARKM
jgi:hypothetical protein